MDLGSSQLLDKLRTLGSDELVDELSRVNVKTKHLILSNQQLKEYIDLQDEEDYEEFNLAFKENEEIITKNQLLIPILEKLIREKSGVDLRLYGAGLETEIKKPVNTNSENENVERDLNSGISL